MERERFNDSQNMVSNSLDASPGSTQMTRRLTDHSTESVRSVRAEIASSAEFRQFVEEQSREAQRRRDDRMARVEAKRQEIARSLADHNTFALRTDGEIAALLDDVADDDEILSAATRALTINRPTLVPHEEVKNALEEQK